MLRNVAIAGAPVEDIPLRACPFCGSAAEFSCTDYGHWSVGCTEDGGEDKECFGYESLTVFPTKRQAAEAWNRREDPKPPRLELRAER